MRFRWGKLFVAATLVTFVGAVAGQVRAQQGDLAPIPLKLPKPAFVGTPGDPSSSSETPPPAAKPRPAPKAPKGTVNLALHKPVTSSSAPFSGTLDLITDGNKEVGEDTAVEIKPRMQWVQIDLGAASPLYYILVWHYHGRPIVFHDVIVQVSDDPTFMSGVTTLFNNDKENAAGQGIGKDREYIENYEGKLVDAHGTKARYVRLYSKGSTYQDPLNRYTEVEVYGLPSK